MPTTLACLALLGLTGTVLGIPEVVAEASTGSDVVMTSRHEHFDGESGRLLTSDPDLSLLASGFGGHRREPDSEASAQVLSTLDGAQPVILGRWDEPLTKLGPLLVVCVNDASVESTPDVGRSQIENLLHKSKHSVRECAPGRTHQMCHRAVNQAPTTELPAYFFCALSAHAGFSARRAGGKRP